MIRPPTHPMGIFLGAHLTLDTIIPELDTVIPNTRFTAVSFYFYS